MIVYELVPSSTFESERVIDLGLFGCPWKVHPILFVTSRSFRLSLSSIALLDCLGSGCCADEDATGSSVFSPPSSTNVCRCPSSASASHNLRASDWGCSHRGSLLSIDRGEIISTSASQRHIAFEAVRGDRCGDDLNHGFVLVLTIPVGDPFDELQPFFFVCRIGGR